MAAAGSAWSMVKTAQAISPRAIEDEVAASFKLALVGSPEHRAALRAALLTDQATAFEREDAESYLRELDAAPDIDSAAAFAFVLYAAEPEERVGARGKNGMPLIGTVDEVVRGMLVMRPDLTLALGRRLPRFRLPACNRLIQATCKVNASIALISALPGVIPISAIFLPVSSAADFFLLTKNQAMLVMRLAAIFGHKVAYTKQWKELAGTLGTALGWRTAARELAGLVPAGVGLALKASIAYSGTAAIGKSALWYLQSGRMPSDDEVREAFTASQSEARDEVEKLQASPPPVGGGPADSMP